MTLSSSITDRPQVYTLSVDQDYEQQRLDNFLFRELKGVPKSKVYQMIRKGEVRVNKKRIKPDYRLQSGDQIRIPPVRQSQAQQEVWVESTKTQEIEKRILFEDDGLIILNKPAGWAVHGGSGISLGIIEALRVSRPKKTLELVHRLDRGTSGCLMIAKKRSVLKRLNEALKEGEVRKTYVALVSGPWSKRTTLVDQPLLKRELPEGGRMVKVDSRGKAAKTKFQLLISNPQVSLIRAMPITGRTHQIRVHCQYAGHSIIGDEAYGSAILDRAVKGWGVNGMCLHAYQLELPDEEGKKMQITAPLPANLQAAMERLKKEKGVVHEKL